MNKDSKSSLIGIIFIIWFIGSIISMVYFSKINEYYTIMIFGQYFLVFGIIPLKSAKGMEKLMSVPFILVGLCCILIPYLIMNPEVLSISLNWDAIIPILLILAFIIAGLAMIFIPIINKNRLKKVCTIMVSAKIIDYKYTYGDNGNKLYSPIYEFDFNGKKHNVSNEVYSNIGNKPIDTIVNLMINPNNPEEYIDNSKVNKFLLVLGIIFLSVSIPVFIYLITTLNIEN